LIKEKGLDIGRREGRLSMEMIKWKGLGSNDQDLKKDQTWKDRKTKRGLSAYKEDQKHQTHIKSMWKGSRTLGA